MSHGRPPRKPRRKALDVMRIAQLRASRLTAEELLMVMAPTQAAATAVREGVATADQVDIVHTAMLIGLAIEDLGVVKGVRAHLELARDALRTIHQRATTSTGWRCTAVYWHELDHITTGLEMHTFQLQHVSGNELQRVVRQVETRARQAGTPVIHEPHAGQAPASTGASA